MKPIMREFPYEFESERLMIRGPLPGDETAVYEAVVESQEALKPWMPWAVEISPIEDYAVRVREEQLNYLARKSMWMLIFLKGTNTLVGCTGYPRFKWDVPGVEIGYWGRTGYGGQGYITEAAARLTELAFDTLGARRVEIHCDALNERSAAVARRLGFPLEGILKHNTRHHLTNELRDTMIFAKVQPD